LDPVAEYFIYDIVYRNRTRFRKDHARHRQSFGYRFKSGKPQSPMTSYREFRKAVLKGAKEYRFSLRLDVALYFNSIYHHDLTAYFAEHGWGIEDVVQLGQFLRQINAGRSIDCLPHGMSPCKTIGAEFLRFVDNSARLRSPLLLRFLDDIYLFSDTAADLTGDQLTIQELLGEKGLSLNSDKTTFTEGPHGDLESEIDAIKVGLLQIRQHRIEVSGEMIEVATPVMTRLTDEQTNYLLELLRDPNIEEADAELVLTLLTEHGDEVLERLGSIMPRFPSLAKTIYTFVKKLPERKGLAELVLDFLQTAENATEYQLFWLAKIAEEFLIDDARFGELLIRLYEHREATLVTQAKVLEIPEHRFGMPELREPFLRSGQSNWLAWAAAVGTRRQTAQSRNHVLSYFANGSALNGVIAASLRRIA